MREGCPRALHYFVFLSLFLFPFFFVVWFAVVAYIREEEGEAAVVRRTVEAAQIPIIVVAAHRVTHRTIRTITEVVAAEADIMVVETLAVAVTVTKDTNTIRTIRVDRRHGIRVRPIDIRPVDHQMTIKNDRIT